MSELNTLATLKANATAYWRFEGNSNDTVGSNNGTDTSITYNTTNGKFGQGAGLNGTSSKIVFTTASALQPTGSFSMVGWVKPVNGASDAAIYQSYAQNTNVAGFLFGMSGGKFRCVIGKNTGTTINVDYTDTLSSATINDGNFHLCVLTFDGSNKKMYVDNVLDQNVSTSIAPAYQATTYCQIGAENHTGSDISHFNGDIDDLAMFKGYELTASDVSLLYNNQLPFRNLFANQAINRASRW